MNFIIILMHINRKNTKSHSKKDSILVKMMVKTLFLIIFWAGEGFILGVHVSTIGLMSSKQSKFGL